MRHPVNNFKTEWNTTAGNGFGVATSYGYHEGVDINDNGGGNSDLGKEIFAISNGELVYWHGAKHPTTGFGYHSVYKITGAWGTRWVHQAHCLADLTKAPKSVSENEKIARVGNSGTGYAHIHFSVFKVDPTNLPNGIDTIAKTVQQLNDWWENPIAFIEKWSAPVVTPTLPEPNPGYAPTFEGQTVEKNGLIYKSYKNDSGKLLWKIEATIDYKKLYEEEKLKTSNLEKLNKELTDKNTALNQKITNAKQALI